MNECKTYALNLEKKLINEFKQKFRDKMGYSPFVITKVSIDDIHSIKLMSLDELADYFKPFVPHQKGRKTTLTSRSRKRELVELRMIFCFIARNMKYTYTSIGLFMGGRDHTTVLHNLSCFRNLIETSEEFREKYLKILNFIKQSHESSDLGKFN